MEVQPKPSTLVAKFVLMLLAVILFTIFLLKASPTMSSAHGQDERVFENTITKDVPIEIRIKKEKEKSFRDLKNEKWAREFELELTNTGEKPIYFLYITLATDLKVSGDRLVFPQVYGRAELGDIVTKARSNDVPIQPGETHVFKIDEAPTWERLSREQRLSQPTRLRAELQELSFGDGTGYFGNHPYPPAGKRQASLDDHIDSMSEGGFAPPPWPSGERSTQVKTLLTLIGRQLSCRLNFCLWGR
jgi:hypothetical protein